MTTLGFIASLTVIGSAIVAGLFMAATGQLMLAVREIALNSRKQEVRGEYKLLELFANMWTILGVLVAAIGTFVGIIGAVSSFSIR